MKQINANAPTPGDIMELAKENEMLRQSNLELAANVEACCELVNMDMDSAIDRLFEIDNTESKSLLNKFAIEQQIKALEEFKKECGMFVPVHKLKGRIEQLRNLIDSDKI